MNGATRLINFPHSKLLCNWHFLN